LATVPVSDASESGSIEPDAAAPRFRQLERVRTRHRARRRNWTILASMLAAAVSGVLGFTATRPPAPARAPEVLPAPAAELQAPALPPLAEPALRPAAAVLRVPPLPRGRRPPADVTAEIPDQAYTPGAAEPPAPAAVTARADVVERAEFREAEGGDPGAVIDWLLKAARPRGQ
jgi:hypothetical protein